jgi:ribosomal protein S18 acetylase RimI-like enzyme
MTTTRTSATIDPAICVATQNDESAILQVITLAFSTDPLVRWGIPRPDTYLIASPRIAKAFGGKAIACGSAYYVVAFAGAALWLPPGVHPDEDALASILLHAVAEPRQRDFFPVFEQMADFHPQSPHWYLPLIGVDPVQQGRGYGSALLRHALRVCDRERTPAYLESSNPRNISLYQRHGFEVLGTIQIGDSPPVFPMLREPRAVSS